jgi:hypothetical protein
MTRIVRRARDSRKCIAPGCGKQPSFGAEWKKPLRCAAHKTYGDRNVVSKRCIAPGCEKLPSFGTEWKKPIHCVAHKTDGERNVSNKRCLEPGCEKQPRFGIEWMKPIHCTTHKTDGERDIASKRCIESDCEKIPSFGTDYGKPIHCAEHKTHGEQNVKDKRCAEPGCAHQPTFGVEWKKPVHCVSHKADDELDVSSKRCIGRDGLPCPTQERAYYGGRRCYYCADDDEVRAPRKKTEARCMKRILRLLGPSVTCQEQFHVPYGCGDFDGKRAFLDAVLDHPRVRVVLEIDECQHARSVSCPDGDLSRMHAAAGELLMRSADQRPIAWVRFNPDDGTVPASAKDQLKRCGDAAKAIRDLIESPRECVVYVNYM